MPGQTRSVYWVVSIALGLCAAAANALVMRLPYHVPMGLYLDTVFTVAVTFLGGLIPGLISAACTTLINGIAYTLINGEPYFWAWYLFMLCSIAAALFVRLFARIFPDECNGLLLSAGEPYRVKNGKGLLLVMLATLSLVLCIGMSIAGGLVAAFIFMLGGESPADIHPEIWFSLGLDRQGYNVLVSEILGRIPINLTDRPVAVFGGFGIALLVKKLYCSINTGIR